MQDERSHRERRANGNGLPDLRGINFTVWMEWIFRLLNLALIPLAYYVHQVDSKMGKVEEIDRKVTRIEMQMQQHLAETHLRIDRFMERKSDEERHRVEELESEIRELRRVLERNRPR